MGKKPGHDKRSQDANVFSVHLLSLLIEGGAINEETADEEDFLYIITRGLYKYFCIEKSVPPRIKPLKKALKGVIGKCKETDEVYRILLDVFSPDREFSGFLFVNFRIRQNQRQANNSHRIVLGEIEENLLSLCKDMAQSINESAKTC